MMNIFAPALIIGAQRPIDTTKEIESKLMSTIEQHFWDPSQSRWREMAGKDDEVFLWGYSVLFSTFAIGAKVDPTTYKPRLERIFDGLNRYWTDKSPGGYAVLPGQSKNPDRYYDDNAWVGLASMEAYSATKEKKYLDVAKRAYQFVMSGEDKKLGGGIYWHENDKKSKNACVSAPASMLAYRMFIVTKEKPFLDNGNRWLEWTEKLRDQNDSLIMDNMSISGKIDRTKWSYNSACYYQARSLRLKAQRLNLPNGIVDTDLEQLIMSDTLSSSYKRWINPKKMLVKNPGVFGMHLLEAIQETKPNETKQITRSVYESCRNEDGLLGEYWDRKPLASEKLKLMYTASLLRTCLLSHLNQK